MVVGAGPAGAAAAIELSRAGLSVLLSDRARFPRDKCCGDGLTTLALRELESLGLDPGTVASWHDIDDVVVRSPSGRTVRFPLPRAQGRFAAVTRRIDLDAALVEVARRRGADVRTGNGVTAARELTDRVELDIDGIGTITAAFAIAADGMWSPMRKHLGVAAADDQRYLGDWHAFRQYFRNVSPSAGRDLVVWFEPDLLPGYAWSFPLADGRANVGFGVLRGGPIPVGDMKELWPDVLRRPHIAEFLGPDAAPEDRHLAWPIPARLGVFPLTTARTLWVGDAAAAADPMTGEGIGQALATGRWAAQSIIGNRHLDASAVTAGYERTVRRELRRDHRFAHSLSTVLARPLLTRGAVRLAGASRWTRPRFARWLFEDYPRALALTPRRWSRGAMSSPGAYRP